MGADSNSMIGLTLGSKDPTPLWIRGTTGWSQPTARTPNYVLAMQPLPEGGLIIATGRDISDQPGVFWLGGNPQSSRQLYDAQAIGALAVAPGSSGSEIYAATAPYGDREADSDILRRDPTSGTWSLLLHGSLSCGDIPPYFKQIVVHQGNPNILFAVEECFAPLVRETLLWRSDDHGRTWRVLPRDGEAQTAIGSIAIDPIDPNIIYLAGLKQHNQPVAGIEVSLDGGQTWALRGETDSSLSGVKAMIVDPHNPLRVLVGTERGSVLMSDDRGDTWRALPELEELRIWALALNHSSDTLYAATSDGIWRIALPSP
jgi:hypothetical protein